MICKYCGNCKYYLSVLKKECLRNPPDTKGNYPKVEYDNYCGEWKSKARLDIFGFITATAENKFMRQELEKNIMKNFNLSFENEKIKVDLTTTNKSITELQLKSIELDEKLQSQITDINNFNNFISEIHKKLTDRNGHYITEIQKMITNKLESEKK